MSRSSARHYRRSRSSCYEGLGGCRNDSLAWWSEGRDESQKQGCSKASRRGNRTSSHEAKPYAFGLVKRRRRADEDRHW